MRQKKFDCVQIVADAATAYEIDLWARTTFGGKLHLINRIPWADENAGTAEPANEETRRVAHNAGRGELQGMIRLALRTGKKNKVELRKFVRENSDMSTGNVDRALDRMHTRGEVRRVKDHWILMEKTNGK